MNIQGITHVSAAHGTESLLDLCFSSIQLAVPQPQIPLTQLSDRYAITGSLKYKPTREPRQLITLRNYSRHISHIQSIGNALDSELMNTVKCCTDLNEPTEILENWIESIINDNIPL